MFKHGMSDSEFYKVAFDWVAVMTVFLTEGFLTKYIGFGSS